MKKDSIILLSVIVMLILIFIKPEMTGMAVNPPTTVNNILKDDQENTVNDLLSGKKASPLKEDLENYQSTIDAVKIEKKLHTYVAKDSKEERSIITITLDPKNPLKNVSVYENISKDVAFTTDEIIFHTDNYEIIDKDPMIVWRFSEVKEKTEISYEIRKKVDVFELEEGSTVIVIKEIDKNRMDFSFIKNYATVLPFIMIPLVGFIIVYFSSFARNKEELDHHIDRNIAFSMHKMIMHIEKEINRGIKKNEITADLLSSGWEQDQIDVAFSVAEQELTEPNQSVQSS